MGVVIGETAEIGDNVTIFSNVTIMNNVIIDDKQFFIPELGF